MVKFARGLCLKVEDRESFEQYIKDNAHDPGATMENWGENSVPEELYINQYKDYDDAPCYKTIDSHVNGQATWNYWNEQLIMDMLNEGLLTNTNEYDVDFVDKNED